MTNYRLRKLKRNFLLKSLILHLLDSWTIFTINPKKELYELRISPLAAQKTMTDLIAIGYVKEVVSWRGREYSTLSIVEHPSLFREAIILTDKGSQIVREGKGLRQIKEIWQNVNRG